MIDADYKEMSAALKVEVGKHGGLYGLTFLINTHWYGDHTQVNLVLGKHALIIAHDNVRARLLTAQGVALFKVVLQPYQKVALPAITYTEVMTLHINDEQVNLVHYANGHTDGDSVVFFRHANVVHMGDHLFAGMYPFVDVQNGGNVLRMAENVKGILPLIYVQTFLIPGHGRLSKKSDLEDFYAMLIGTVAEVREMKAVVMDLEEIPFEGLSEQWQQWGDGFLSEEVWIGIIAASLFKP
jgi:glyoxylase-like metal-dependent hydrolase (beta-lactamase superfamily II)